MDILVYDNFVRVEFSSEKKKSFPKKEYNSVFNFDKILFEESGTDIIQLEIRDVNLVDSITDNQTGGAGAIAVPATLKLLFDTLEPYFYQEAGGGGGSLGSSIVHEQTATTTDAILTPVADSLQTITNSSFSINLPPNIHISS